jgi:hypothetical protein
MTSSASPAGTPDTPRGSDDPNYPANLRGVTLASSVGSALATTGCGDADNAALMRYYAGVGS